MKAIIPVLWDYLFYICFVKSVILPYRENILKIIAKQLHLDYCLHDEDNSIKTYLKDFQLIKTGGFINGVLNKKKDLDFELKIFDWSCNVRGKIYSSKSFLKIKKLKSILA
jgi:hypothetical protein